MKKKGMQSQRSNVVALLARGINIGVVGTRFASYLIFTGYSLAGYKLVITGRWIVAICISGEYFSVRSRLVVSSRVIMKNCWYERWINFCGFERNASENNNDILVEIDRARPADRSEFGSGKYRQTAFGRKQTLLFRMEVNKQWF